MKYKKVRYRKYIVYYIFIVVYVSSLYANNIRTSTCPCMAAWLRHHLAKYQQSVLGLIEIVQQKPSFETK